MSQLHDEFAAVLLARNILTPEQLVEAWRRASWEDKPLENVLVRSRLATPEQIKDARLGWADLLVVRQVISAEQLADAREIANKSGAKLTFALVKLGYVTDEQVTQTIAEFYGVQFIDLTDVTIPLAVVELMPESVARENRVLPLALEDTTLKVIISDPTDLAMLEKLQFILNKAISPVLAPKEQIIEAIDRHYGMSETESVDSMLAEFTDTAIDFTETEATRCDTSIDLASSVEPTMIAPRVTEWRATVRYYSRMNPQRLVPLLVVLSREEVQQVAKAGVRQVSQTFRVAEGTVVEIEPILPGCVCHPPREQVRIGSGDVTITFWVVPQILGRVMQARVVVRQEGDALADIPLDVCVVQQSVTRLVGALSLVLPFGLFLLKQAGLDFDSQAQEGFSLYAEVAKYLLGWLTPEVLTLLLLVATLGLYLWLRPRRREVFWDITTRQSPATSAPAAKPNQLLSQATKAIDAGDATEGERQLRELLSADSMHVPGLLLLAKQRDEAGQHRTALELYERALKTGKCQAIDYHRAAIAAFKSAELDKALRILQRAEALLPAGQMKGAMYYNMGCFAARLGRLPEALRYLNTAVDHGFDELAKYRTDPDLELLRWNAGFRQLLAELAR